MRLLVLPLASFLSRASEPRATLAMAAFRNPNNLPTKVCVSCGKPFTWRKKWEKNWDEITTCSKRCNSERRRASRRSGVSDDASSDGVEAAPVDGVEAAPVDGAKAARKAARKAAKAESRARREGRAAGSAGQKHCDVCSASVNLLVRCQLGPSQTWSMVCGPCWGKPAVAGGVVDGSGENPHYRYGGLWKNHQQA